MSKEGQARINQLNAQHSTGPITVAGKKRASRNALRHGIFSSQILPGEDATQWNQFLEATTAALQPDGAVQCSLASRVAILLWRMKRVTDYELSLVAEQVAADPAAAANVPGKELTHCEELRKEIEDKKEALRLWKNDQRLTYLLKQTDASSISSDEAYGFFEMYHLALPALCPLQPDDPRFLKNVLPANALEGDDPYGETSWTVAMLRKGLEFYAQQAGISREALTAKLIETVTSQCRSLQGDIRRLHKEVRSHLVKHAEQIGLQRARHAIPNAEKLENIVRYESHLGKQLRAALHQFLQLQRGPFSKLTQTISLDVLTSEPQRLAGRPLALQNADTGGNGALKRRSAQTHQHDPQDPLAALANGEFDM